MKPETGIVVVSASSDTRRFLKSLLEAAHRVTFEAVDRAHAMNVLERYKISVIISDCQLPDGDWKDFLSATACMPEPPRLIVVAAAAPRHLWAEVLNLGGSEVLSQPLNAEEVRRAVEVAAEAWTRRREPVVRKPAAASVSATWSASGSAGNQDSVDPDETRPDRRAILVIDDDARVRRMLQVLLRTEGYEVLLAENGSEGIETFRRHAHRIALVLLDYEMPGMNGDQVFDQLAAIKRDVKVLVSSGQSASEILMRFAGRTVADFLPKPFSSKGLNEKIRSALAA